MSESKIPPPVSPPHSLNFKFFKISKIVYQSENLINESPFDIDVQFINEYPDASNRNVFHTVFVVKITDQQNDSTFQLQAIGGFEISVDVKESIHENYTLISAPSIVFPYIRAFISNLFIQTGSSPLILPPINFVARYHDLKSKSDLEKKEGEKSV